MQSFIEENHEFKLQSRSHQARQRQAPGMPSQDVMSYWGYKFETLSLLPTPWHETTREYIEQRPNQTVSNYSQYCSVVKTSVGSCKLVIGGEVDAVWDRRPSDTSQKLNWVELKTSAEIRSDKDAIKFERKLNKFWAQSFLLGVPKVIVGFRTNDSEGVLLRLQEFETTKIPSLVRRGNTKTWESNVCINFTASFLAFIKDTIHGDGIWRIRKGYGSRKIEILRIDTQGYGGILSPEFVQWRMKLGSEVTENFNAI